MEKLVEKPQRPALRALPGDDVRQIMWRFSERFDLQMVAQSARAIARGPVARLVAAGARHTHEWTPAKNELLAAYDAGGITSAFMEPSEGGYIEGPKNLLLALIAFELAWVDGGAATCSLATHLGLSPIHECGTEEQKAVYMAKCAPAAPGEDRSPCRAAFALTEPIPFVGVDTGVLGGRLRIVEWKEGEEPILQVEKRGRFITGMDFASIVTAAVDSDDPRIKGSCMVIIEEDDPGTWDRGAVTMKMVHQLSSTRDPVFNLRVPASRIVGGYTIKNGVIIPNLSHSEVIESVFRRTRVTVGLMTAAKLLSAVEPVIRYQRQRFRGGAAENPESPRYQLGIQIKEDALHRLVDVWATGEAAASLGFAAARLFDEFDPMEKTKREFLKQSGVDNRRSELKARKAAEQLALEFIQLDAMPEAERKGSRYESLKNDQFVQYVLLDAQANVYCPACKLWNTGHGADVMRQAVSLMGGYGITEDCPGFLFHKWMDAQLEATYEGPEAVQRRQLSVTMLSPLFLAQFRNWAQQMRVIANARPRTGACALATAMGMWLWTIDHLQTATDAHGAKLYNSARQGVTFPLADALCWLLASRSLVLDTIELEQKGAQNPNLADGLDGITAFYEDLCHVQIGESAGQVGRICAELVHGYNRHPEWKPADCGCCFCQGEMDQLEGVMPGLGASSPDIDVIEDNGSHMMKAGPCVKMKGIERFVRMRTKMDGCLTGCRLAKDRAAKALTEVMIPEAQDYPM